RGHTHRRRRLRLLLPPTRGRRHGGAHRGGAAGGARGAALRLFCRPPHHAGVGTSARGGSGRLPERRGNRSERSRAAALSPFATERSSSFKRALRQLPVGAAVGVGEPDGDFVVGDPGDEHVLIAGGIGVTPFRAILLDLDHRELPINATLLYANRSPDFVYKAEIDRLTGRHRRLVVRYLVSPERVTQSSIRGVAADLAKPIFHVSGPEPFVEALGTMLTGL